MIYGIIPVHDGSKRFRNKFLVELDGKPLFWHVWDRARQSVSLDMVWVATDSEAIMRKCDELDVPYLSTGECSCGTERVYCAITRYFEDGGKYPLQLPGPRVSDFYSDYVVNIQGDEPEIDPATIDAVVAKLKDGAYVVTPGCYGNDPDRVRIAVNDRGRAVFFSRKHITNIMHIGVYGFSYSMLQRFFNLGRTPLEEAESLEQMRLIEHGIPIDVVMVENAGVAIDKPDDLKKLNKNDSLYSHIAKLTNRIACIERNLAARGLD